MFKAPYSEQITIISINEFRRKKYIKVEIALLVVTARKLRRFSSTKMNLKTSAKGSCSSFDYSLNVELVRVVEYSERM